MIKVAGAWELGWSAPISEYDLWAFMLRDFGVDEWIMSPVSGLHLTKRNFIEVPDLQQAITWNPDLAPVFVDEAGAVPLAEFQHPENVIYVLGKAAYSPLRSLKISGALSVRVETKENKGLLWPHQAAAIVLHDRLVKS